MIPASAIIVTRGDVSLEETRAPLDAAFNEVLVWNNIDLGDADAKCYGRFKATAWALHEDVAFIDDDVVFHHWEELYAAYLANDREITANMTADWVTRGGYEDLCLFGAGSFMQRNAWKPAVERYLSIYPYDDDFITYCDPIIGLLTPHHVVDFGFDILPWAVADNRIARAPGQAKRKQMMLARGRALRDA